MKHRNAFAPPKFEHDTSLRAREQEVAADPQSKGKKLTGTVGGWWVRADPNVQMAKAKAQSAATWSGTELVSAAVQQGKTLNCVVMTMRL